MLSRSHVSWNCVSGTVLRVPQVRSLFCFFFGFCVCVLCLCLCFLFAVALWCIDFLRSISSLTDLRPVGDKIDLKKSRHHKHSSKHKNKDTGKEKKHKNNKKQNNDLPWGTLNTAPETQLQETCDRESITLPMSFGLNWTKRGSAVHCELPYFKIVSKQNPTWWIKVKAPPWPLAQRPRTVLLSRWSRNQSWEAKCSTSSCKAVATSKAMQKIHKHVGSGKRICCEWKDKGKNLMCGGILCEAVVPWGDLEGWLCSKTKGK